MENIAHHTRVFYVVQFLEPPFEGIDDYVCVPYSWVILRRDKDQMVSVAYPQSEDPFVTRDRAKRREKHADEWRCYMAVIKYQSDTYKDSEYWIASRNDYGPLVDEASTTNDTQQKLIMKRTLRGSSSQSQQDASQPTANQREKPRIPLPKILIKRAVPADPKEQHVTKRLKLDDVVDANVQPRCSRSQQPSTDQDNPSTSNAQAQAAETCQQPAGQPEPVHEQNIEMVLSTDHVPSNETPASQHKPSSVKMSAQLYNHMKTKPCLIPKHDPIEKQIRLKNVVNNITTASQNPSAPLQAPAEKQPPMSQKQSQGSPPLEVPAENSDRKIPSRSNMISSQEILHVFNRNVLKLTNRMSSNATVPQQEQPPLNHQDSQQQQSKPRRSLGIISQCRNDRPTPGLQGITKRTTSRNLLRQTLTSIRNCLLNEQRSPASVNRNLPVIDSLLQEVDNTSPFDEYMAEEPTPLHNGVASDYKSASDPKTTSDSDTSADEAQEARYDFGYGRIPVAKRSPTNQQTHSSAVLQRKMLDQFDNMFAQMGANFCNASRMYKTLRRSILETANTYRQLLVSADQFYNSACAEAPQATDKKLSGAPERNNYSDRDYDNNLANNEYNTSWRFVLPPEHDPNDTKWTLRYQENLPGLVELMPQSEVYVSYGELQYCHRVSKDCKTLARRLLSEVFSKRALSVCLSITEKAQAAYKVGPPERPLLDEHACMVLVNSVINHGRQRGWDTDIPTIISEIHSKVQKMRFKHGVMTKC